jgi:nucleotide-binding universal stress UspA family protein
MFKIILVPTDGSPLSDKAVEKAVEFARLHGSKIIGLSVAEPYPFTSLYEGAVIYEPEQYEDKMRQLAEQHVQAIANAASKAGVACEAVVVQSFNPHEEIIGTAKKYGCDAIFMASHGRRGLNRLILGSETQKVLAHSDIPVLVIR